MRLMSLFRNNIPPSIAPPPSQLCLCAQYPFILIQKVVREERKNRKSQTVVLENLVTCRYSRRPMVGRNFLQQQNIHTISVQFR